jgi:hypothetical protein
MITALSVIAGMIVAWYIVTWAASYITWFVVARGSVKSFQRHTGNFAEFWRLKKQGGLTDLETWSLVRRLRGLTDEEWEYYSRRAANRDARRMIR